VFNLLFIFLNKFARENVLSIYLMVLYKSLAFLG